MQSYAYSLGPAGNRSRIDEQDGTSRHYQHDALYRLVQDRVTNVDGDQVYQREFVYDPVGNRLSQTIDLDGGPTTVSSTYDNRDRLLSSASATYDWNIDGNLINRTHGGGVTYRWDDENRLTSVTLVDGTEMGTDYDADGSIHQVVDRRRRFAGRSHRCPYTIVARG